MNAFLSMAINDNLCALNSYQKTLIQQRSPMNILVGISGGIAAYKSPELVRRLRERGINVRVVMTQSATAFIGELTLQAVSGNPVFTKLVEDFRVLAHDF